MLRIIKEEILRFTAKERIFILCAMLCGFCISAEYAVVRPVSNAVFITSYSSEAFPWAWLAVVPLNFLIVALYNRFLPQLGCFKMFLITTSAIIGGNIFCALFMKQFSSLPFIFYVWKEIYVLLMFQQLWSVIHSTVKLDKAKYLYGLLFAVGGFGGVMGSILPGFFAVKMGSENLLYATLPIYLALMVAYFWMLKHTDTLPKNEWEKESSWQEGFQLIKSSKYLMFILFIVLFMQISSTVVYYQFNTILETTIGDKDMRTEYCGRVLGIVNSLTIGLQLFGSFLFVHFLGLRASHIMIPCALSINALGCLLLPTFPMISYAYITIKACDFSIFGVIKEMLYIPLKIDEKFHAKAIIDVFAYRTAKAFASFLILFFQFVHAPFSFLSWGSIFLFALWSLIVLRMYQHKEETVA